MTRRGWIAIALVVWMIVVALRGVSVSALPNHVVAGGVFGVGGSVSQGPANPANAAGLVFYSTNQVGYTPLTGTDSYTPADGTNPALFARDIGAQWNWVDGDEIVAVVETVRGINGWTGKNSTTNVGRSSQCQPSAWRQCIQPTAQLRPRPRPTASIFTFTSARAG